MTENTSEKDKNLSFKEKILQDLERASGSTPHPDIPVVSSESSVAEVSEEKINSDFDTDLLARYLKKQEEKFTGSQPEEVKIPEQGISRKLQVSYKAVSTGSNEPSMPKPQQPVPLLNQEQSAKFAARTPEREATQSSSHLADQKEDPKEPISRRKRQETKVKKVKPKKKSSLVGRIVTIVTLLLLVAIAVAGFFGYTYVSSALEPVDAKNTQYVTVEIPEGSGNKQIAAVLKNAGLIKDVHVFNYYSKFKNYSNYQSGYYNLQRSMDLDTIAQKLQEGGTETPKPPVVGKVTVPEGYTIDQIAQVVTVNAGSKKKEKTGFSAEDFLKVIQDEAFIEKEIAKYPKLLASLPSKESGVKYRLEGYLFPATYNYGEKTNLENLIDQMLAAMDKAMSQYYDVLESKNLTVNDALTMASLVEKEGSTDADRKDIASVFYNRLNQGMQLQSNIAILYAQGKLGQKTTLAEDAGIDTEIDSPYNVYKNTGLMPGAVDNPGLSAIEAAVNPNKTDYLYFVANVETGHVYFAQTFEEHDKNVQEHVNSKLTQASQ